MRHLRLTLFINSRQKSWNQVKGMPNSRFHRKVNQVRTLKSNLNQRMELLVMVQIFLIIQWIAVIKSLNWTFSSNLQKLGNRQPTSSWIQKMEIKLHFQWLQYLADRLFELLSRQLIFHCLKSTQHKPFEWIWKIFPILKREF